MDQKFNTSFIPKKFLAGDVGGGSVGDKYTKRRKIITPGYFLSILLFIAAILVSGWIFAWTRVTQFAVEDSTKLLEERWEKVNTEITNDLVRLDTRMRVVSTLLEQHVAPTAVLAVLEDITLADVKYTTLGLAVQGTTGSVRAVVEGEAKEYQEIALQMDQYRLNEYFKTPLITQLKQSTVEKETNKKTFTIGFEIDPKALLYVRTLGNPTAKPAENRVPAPPQVPDSATSSKPTTGTSTGAQ